MSELFPTKTIALEYLDCTDLSRDYAFNYWYNRNLIPELLRIPGVAGVYRYRNLIKELREGQARYLTIYRLDPRLGAAQALAVMQAVKEATAKKAAQEGWSCLESRLVTVWDFLVMRRSVTPPLRSETHLPDGMPEGLFVVPTICTDRTREDEFNDWYINTHFHDLLETPGLVQAHRYRTLNPQPLDDDAEYLALYEIDAEDPFAVTRRILEDDRNIRIPQGRMITCIRAVYGFATYQHIDL